MIRSDENGPLRGLELARSARRRITARLAAEPALRAAVPAVEDVAFIAGPPGGTRTSLDLIAAAFARYADRPCLGERSRLGSTALAPSFHTASYAEVWTRAGALASAWAHLDLVGAGDHVALAGFASIELVVAELACLRREAVAVPLQTSLPAADLARIVDDTGSRWIVCSRAALAGVAEALASCGRVAGVVVIDDHGEAAVDLPAGWQAHTIAALEALGHQHGAIAPAAPASDDPIRFLLYTSGSTGRPRGVMHRDSEWRAVLREAIAQHRVPVITVGYLPLCHLAGHHSVFHVLLRGGTTYFVPRSDMSTLFEDIRLVRPTVMTLIPRVSMLVYQHFLTELARRGGELESPIAHALMSELRETYLGDRLTGIGTGMAPTPPEVKRFLETCFEVPIADTYGSTELGPVTVEDRIQPWVRYKLVDVPELGYRSSDRPFPRGELLVRSERAAAGYFGEPASSVGKDADGYVSSGDIVEERGPGHVVWIDRKSSVLRLSNGEFVALSRLEDVYVTGSPLIAQLYLHGTAERPFLLGVVVPDRTALLALHADALLDEAAMRTLLRREVDRVAKAARLPAHEIPRDFVVAAPFTTGEGLLTESGKQRRPALRARFGATLDALYAAIEARQRSALDEALTRSELSVGQRLPVLLSAVLGLDADALPDDATFVGLGGDSLLAVRFCALLQQASGVSLPVATILDRTMSLPRLRRAAEARAHAGGSATFEMLHGRDARRVRASDLAPDRLLGGELAAAAAATTPPRVVLLTGANGFLGRFILLELLQRLAPERSEVVCLVRAPDDEAAARRLRDAFSSDASLLAELDAASARVRLSVRAAELMAPSLGLAPVRYEELAERVDAIVHCGALVNHALSYAQLFEPNLLGTVEVARLALRRRAKSVHFVSSTSVLAGLGGREVVLETDRASALWPVRGVGGPDEYAVGYGTSKWAAEVFLEGVHERLSAPISIYRCSIALPHRRFAAQLNADDLATRLLRSVSDTGLAPVSFFDEGVPPSPFDGMPVDHVASAIAALSLAPSAGLSIHHVVQSDPEAPSLDRIVDWIAARQPIERLPHAAWFAAFRARLEALDPTARRSSAWSTLHAWSRPLGQAARPAPRAALRIDDSSLRQRLRDLGLDDRARLDEEGLARLLSDRRPPR